jgi:hypothetical protein
LNPSHLHLHVYDVHTTASASSDQAASSTCVLLLAAAAGGVGRTGGGWCTGCQSWTSAIADNGGVEDLGLWGAVLVCTESSIGKAETTHTTSHDSIIGLLVFLFSSRCIAINTLSSSELCWHQQPQADVNVHMQARTQARTHARSLGLS